MIRARVQEDSTVGIPENGISTNRIVGCAGIKQLNPPIVIKGDFIGIPQLNSSNAV